MQQIHSYTYAGAGGTGTIPLPDLPLPAISQMAKIHAQNSSPFTTHLSTPSWRIQSEEDEGGMCALFVVLD